MKTLLQRLARHESTHFHPEGSLMFRSSFSLLSPRYLGALWLVVAASHSPVSALETSALKDQTCAGFRTGNLTCSAGEFTVSPLFSAAEGTPPFCVAGQSFNFKVELGLSGTNTDRQDIGFFVGQQGNDPRVATAGNICSVATFPKDSSPWEDNDGDACGDFNGGGVQTTIINEIKVTCQGDSTGALQLPYVLTYWQNAGNVCTGPSNVTNGAPSKCNAGTSPVSGDISVYSGAYIDVTMETAPDGDSQPFSFTATGPSGSRVVAVTGATLTPDAVTGGTYTPSTRAATTNSTTVSLNDGQTARFFINALAANQTLTIAKTSAANWESTASISCSPVRGSPATTTDNATRTITSALNTTNSATACTITNTKRSRISLTADISGRSDAADQFTVSATGGGTLVGTTSATTAGAGATASTTFYSTPATAMTLAVAKAAGPTSLSRYDTRLTCTNSFAGPGATPNASLPSNLSTASTSITPAPGDDIACTYVATPRSNPPTISVSFDPTAVAEGQSVDLSFTVDNPNGVPLTGISFANSLPGGLGATNATVSSVCGPGSSLAVTGGDLISLTAGSLGASASCTFSVTVTASTAGLKSDTTDPINSTESGVGEVSNTASLTVYARPTVSVAFGDDSIVSGGSTSLTLTLGNPNASALSLTSDFTATLPAGMTLAAAGSTGTCAGVTAANGAGTVSVASGTSLPAGGCTVVVSVTSTTAGTATQTVAIGDLVTTGGSNAAAASDSLTVYARPTVAVAFGDDSIVSGGSTSLTLTLGNGNASALSLTSGFTATLPVGM
ncbi:MAG: DUF7933 domain-containing protein, partial [Deferrisomatales bacterium]